MKLTARFFLFVCLIGSILGLSAKYRPERKADVSNKALITKKAPPITTESKASAADSRALHKLADDYYTWRNENYPVASSDSGSPHLGRSPDRLFAPRRSPSARSTCASCSIKCAR